jgi:hypothetical protein
VVDGGGDTWVAVGGVADRPFQAAAGADIGGPGGTDLGEVVAEDVGGAAAVGAVHDVDVDAGQVRAGVEGGDGRVVPLGDLAEEDAGEDGPGEPQRGAPLRVSML